MKQLITLAPLVLSIFICSCNSSTNADNEEVIAMEDSEKKNESGIGFSTSECIRNAIYYLETTDMQTYDSLDTRYFNEIMGYRKSSAIELEDKIISIKENIANDTMNDIPAPIRDEMNLQIDSLKIELDYYKKEVIGYVFVHTYTSLSDTLSAIIVMNKNCSSTQAIPVSTVSSVNPNDYSYRIQQINEKEI